MRKLQGSWLSNYLKYTEETESPKTFHLFCGLMALASITERKAYLDLGYITNFPNLFTVLVAGSQKCRKSTAIKFMTEVLNLTKNVPNIPAVKSTPERLIADLAEFRISQQAMLGTEATSSALLVVPEMSVYLNKGAVKNGLIAILVDLYDCHKHWEHKTIGRGSIQLKNVYLNFIAGSSPEYLRISLPPDEVGGGMLARTLLVCENRPSGPVPIPYKTEEQEKLMHNLAHDLDHIHNIAGELKLSKEATDSYTKWYYIWFRDDKFDKRDPAMASYYAKKPDHVLSIAQLLSISESDSLIVTDKHITNALKILGSIEGGMSEVLAGIMASPIGHKTHTVLLKISELELRGIEATRSTILQQLHKQITAFELTTALDTLTEANQLTVDLTGGKPVYKIRSGSN